MRKAALGAILLGAFAFTFGSPLREFRLLHSLVSLAGLAAYVVLFLDAGTAGRRERGFLVAGALVGLASFLLVVLYVPGAALAARVLAVATVALPLWPLAGPAQFAFVVAAALALFTGLPSVSGNPYATSVHAYLAAADAFWVAAIEQRYRAGEIPERKHGDLRQDLESR